MVAGRTGLVEPEGLQENMATMANVTDDDSQVEQPWSLVVSPVAEDQQEDKDDDQLDDDDDNSGGQDAGSTKETKETKETEEADEFEDFDDDDFDDEFDDDFEEELDEDYDANEDNFGDDFDSKSVDFPGDDSFGKPTGDAQEDDDKAKKKSTD